MRRVLTFSLLVLLVAARVLPALPPPAELPGPLVLSGAATPTEAAKEAVFRLSGKENAVLVVVSTGSDADASKSWEGAKLKSVSVLRVADKEAADGPAVAKSLADATCVWFADGTPSQHLAIGQGTEFAREIAKLQKRGGTLGGAAGWSAVVGDRTLDGGAGLGLLPGFIVDANTPTKRPAEKLAAELEGQPDHVGLGLGESGVLALRGRHLFSLGDTPVTLCAAAGAGKPRVNAPLEAGNLLDLFQLRRSAANRAAKEPFPPKSPKEPVVERGSLVIVGGGGAGPEIWKKFLELAGGPDALIVFVPTALEDPIGFSFPEVTMLQRFGAKKVHVLHTRDRAKADDPKFSEPLTRAGGVWFGGGRQWRFVEAYEGTLTEKRFHDVLGRGGVIGGSSAGASIQSEYMPRGHPLGNTVMMAEGYEKGFGFLPGAAVDQHFFARKRTGDMTDLMAAYPQYLGIGIDEGTAIVVTGSRADVIGKTKVGFYDHRNGPPKGDKDYIEVEAGGAFDLKARNPVKVKAAG